MINEHTVHLRSTNNNAKIAFFTLLLLAVGSFVVYFVSPLYKGVIGLVGIIFITATVLIYTKYLGAEYYYDITKDSSGCPIFVVRQIVGKRQSTLCRVGLAEILKAEREDAAARRTHKTPFGTKKYVYTPTLMPAVTYRLITKSRYEEAEIVIEASDEFAELILSYAEEARLLELEEED